MKKVNIHFNIHSLLYNNDQEALETLKQLNKYNTYKSYDKEPIQKIVNKIPLQIRLIVDYPLFRNFFALHLDFV